MAKETPSTARRALGPERNSSLRSLIWRRGGVVAGLTGRAWATLAAEWSMGNQLLCGWAGCHRKVGLFLSNPHQRAFCQEVVEGYEVLGGAVDAAVGGGFAEGAFIAGAVDVDVAVEGIDLGAGVGAGLEALEP